MELEMILFGCKLQQPSMTRLQKIDHALHYTYVYSELQALWFVNQ